MKKYNAITKTLAAALLFLGACVNPFINPMKRESPAGAGLVRIVAETGAERTALPAWPEGEVRYEYRFSPEGEEGEGEAREPVAPGETEFVLEPGDWRVTVLAYLETDALFAKGSASFAVPGAGEVRVALSPISEEGEGTLSAALSYPAGVTVRSFSLTRLADTTEIDLIGSETPGDTGFARELSVPAGHWVARAVLEKGGITAGQKEVVRIGANLTTPLGFAFTEHNFKAILAISSADSGPGSLREAVAKAPPLSTIVLDLPGDQPIALDSTLVIDKALTIQGGGATVTRGLFTGGPLVSIASLGGSNSVTMSRFHFTGGRNAGNGGAVIAAGKLILESCVFSDNRAGGKGGAVYTTAQLTVRGSTFYGNRAETSGGAICSNTTGANTALTGNLFYGNSAPDNPVVEADQFMMTSVSSSNIADGSVSGTNAAQFKQVDGLTISPLSFRPLGGLENGAEGHVGPRPAGYPVVDFYGVPVPATGVAAGAAQTPTAAGRYFLDYAAAGAGTLTVQPEVDEDGLAAGSVTLTAEAGGNGEFRGWIVDGVKGPEAPESLALTLDKHTAVRALFYVKTSAVADHVPGSLRDAIVGAGGGGVILPAGEPGESVVLRLDGDLAITENLVIEGKGATIDLNGHHILVGGAATEVAVSRVRFANGAAASCGAAIQNEGRLSLESCVFSSNRITGQGTEARGGALWSSGTLSVVGCTFYGNSAGGGQGGAIHLQSGILTLQGNLFWGNTAASNLVVSKQGGTVTSEGFNLSDAADADGSGFSHGDDKYATGLPLSSVSFRPFTNGAAATTAARPEGYPLKDFYGDDIPAENLVIGAVQERVEKNGFVLNISARGPGRVEPIAGSVNGDGLVSGSVTLSAVGNTGAVEGTFKRWIVNGVEEDVQVPPEELSLDISADTTVTALFSGVYNVDSGANGGPGSFREALGMAGDGGEIVLHGQTVTLAEPPLPLIAKELTITGNGATLTQAGFVSGESSQLIALGPGGNLRISAVRFAGGRAANGGAIRNNGGSLLLESCVFDGNQASSQGGALHNAAGEALVKGCTFVGNTAAAGGAVYRTGGTLTLTGNLFWGNAGVAGGSVSSGGFNVSDRGSGSAQSGWNFVTGDREEIYAPLDISSYKPLSNGAAYRAITARPDGYPATDFYGDPIPAENAMAGAVQAEVVMPGYVLDLGSVGLGRVEVKTGVPVDGLYSDSVTLKAAVEGDNKFMHWIVNGVKQDPQEPPDELTLAMDSHKTVRGVFLTFWAVTDQQSLDNALAHAVAGDHIVFPDKGTITLTSSLPPITTSLIIEGNGSTLTQEDFLMQHTGHRNPLLDIDSSEAEVTISRLHFKGGRSYDNGAAIRNTGGKLTLESCIFSDNHVNMDRGGAIYTTGNTTISGCTFVGNVAEHNMSRGGAISRGSGTLTLTGNVFWENTANTYPVVHGGSVSSGGYNISDKPGGTGNTQSGWTFLESDKEEPKRPLDSDGFRPFSNRKAYQAIVAKPDPYPIVDFNGNPIPGTDAMAGAVQTAIEVTGFELDIGATIAGTGTVTVLNGTEAGGFYSGEVTLEATAAEGNTFLHWTVNGNIQPDQNPPNQLTITAAAGIIVRGVFINDQMVADETGLQAALTNAKTGDTIVFAPGATIELSSAWTTSKNITITIEGNGATLMPKAGFTTNATSQLLYIGSSSANFTIRRLHFKDGRATNNGAAIQNRGILTLESCIFSGNTTTTSSANGGAIYTNGNTTISGCTFVENTAGTTSGKGGAIYRQGGTLTLKGNLFWGNTANTCPVVYASSVSSGGYNISDRSSGTGTSTTASGWTFVSGDAQATALPLLSAFGFKPLSNGAAYQAVATRPASYPALDFNGVSIPATNAMAGAVQTAIAGYMLDHAATGQGTVTVTSGSPNEYGMYSGSVTLKAEPIDNSTFMFWTVNGAEAPSNPPDELTITMDGQKTVRGVFATTWQVTNGGNAGDGSLRAALTSAQPGDAIVFTQGLTVTLTAPLDAITKSLIIQGNGSVLQSAITPSSADSRLLFINSATAEVRISRLHFKDGKVIGASNGGGAISHKAGKLILESCIFSGNQTVDYFGGAIFANKGTTTIISGCTFSNNSANGYGGTISVLEASLTIIGNIFRGGIAKNNPVIDLDNKATFSSNGYNVSDKASGTGGTQSGWAFISTDKPLPDLTLDDNFKPVSAAGLPVVPSPLPEGFPATYFDGSPRGSTPGAMPSN